MYRSYQSSKKYIYLKSDYNMCIVQINSSSVLHVNLLASGAYKSALNCGAHTSFIYLLICGLFNGAVCSSDYEV
jgi:hypothetical protein